MCSIYCLKLLKYPELNNILKYYKKSKSMAIDKADGLALYEKVISLRPNYILELGPGTSTAVISLAISRIKNKNKLYNPKFIAIDDSEEWLGFHNEMFPNDLRDNVELISRDCSTEVLNEEKLAYFLDIPDFPYEFIHVDGPNNTKFGAKASSDVIRLSRNIKGCVIYFDARQKTARITCRILGVDYQRHFFTLNPLVVLKN